MSSLEGLAASGRIAPDWAEALAPVEGTIHGLGEFLRAEEAAGRGFQPSMDRIFRAFERPLADVRVLVVGQDPYPNPRHPIGLSFAVERGVWPLPPSLVNIYVELRDDLAIMPPRHGDLSAWADRGVMLLNRVLTVTPAVSNSHRGRGWEEVTACAISALASRGGPCAAILWGSPARALKPTLGEIPAVESPHPSPLSAYRGFFGSKPFSRVNAMLEAQGASAIDWRLPE